MPGSSKAVWSLGAAVLGLAAVSVWSETSCSQAEWDTGPSRARPTSGRPSVVAQPLTQLLSLPTGEPGLAAVLAAGLPAACLPLPLPSPGPEAAGQAWPGTPYGSLCSQGGSLMSIHSQGLQARGHQSHRVPCRRRAPGRASAGLTQGPHGATSPSLWPDCATPPVGAVS